jgi:hypothetical protein
MTAQYSIVRFSPVPEQTEFVNVALLFSDPRVGLVYDERFPKLTCIAPYFDTGFLVEYLSAVVANAGARDFQTAAGEVSRASAQFRLSAARELARPLTQDIVARLTKAHLARAEHTHRRETAAERRRIEPKLEEFLSRYMAKDRPAVRLRAKPEQYLSDEIVKRLRDPKFTIARVVTTPDHLIAIDGVDLSLSDTAVERRAVSVSFAYDMLVGAAEPIRRFENRDVYRAALVFGQPRSVKQEHAIDMLSRYASAVVRPDAVPPELAHLLSAAAAVLPSVGV